MPSVAFMGVHYAPKCNVSSVWCSSRLLSFTLPATPYHLPPTELDSTNPKLFADPRRVIRVARGAGRHPLEVQELLEEYKKMDKIWSKMKGLKMMTGGGKKGEMSMSARNMNAAQMARALPPQMLQQMGGLSGLQGLMKQMNSKDFAGMFGGAAGGRD